MRRSRITWLAALAALLFSLVIPHVQAAWQCEGRTCGTTPWFCCCDSPAASRDTNCDEPTSRDAEDGTCATDCGCVMTVRAVHDSCRGDHQGARTQHHPAARLAPPTGYEPLLPGPAARRCPESRGPPCARALLAPPSLRAPPAA